MLTIGIGCRHASRADQIGEAIRHALHLAFPLPAGYDAAAFPITQIASIDQKADAPGLLAYCAEHALPLRLFSRDALAAAPGPSPASAAVQARFGIGGVCESAALCASPGGRLLLGKTTRDGVAIAIALALTEPR